MPKSQMMPESSRVPIAASKRRTEAAEGALCLPGAVVLSDEGCDGNAEGIDNHPEKSRPSCRP